MYATVLSVPTNLKFRVYWVVPLINPYFLLFFLFNLAFLRANCFSAFVNCTMVVFFKESTSVVFLFTESLGTLKNFLVNTESCFLRVSEILSRYPLCFE